MTSNIVNKIYKKILLDHINHIRVSHVFQLLITQQKYFAQHVYSQMPFWFYIKNSWYEYFQRKYSR